MSPLPRAPPSGPSLIDFSPKDGDRVVDMRGEKEEKERSSHTHTLHTGAFPLIHYLTCISISEKKEENRERERKEMR